MRWFALAEKSKWDRKYGLTKEDAIARWFTGKTPKVIQTRRPSEFMAKRTTRYTQGLVAPQVRYQQR